jgi:hypothetical protein
MSRQSFSPPYEEPAPTIRGGAGGVGQGFFVDNSLKNVDVRFEPPQNPLLAP